MDEHELYGVSREQFIAERTGWAKALRAEGRRQEASRVAALRKPSVPAWTVNQLVRNEPDRFADLLNAGDALRTAQDRMVSGNGSAAELRTAAQRERDAVDALLAVAAPHGMSGTVSDRVAATLHAAALDAGARSLVSAGQLVEELQHVGFGGPALAGARASSARKPERSSPGTASAAESPPAQERKRA